jgi:hypothetical protein
LSSLIRTVAAASLLSAAAGAAGSMAVSRALAGAEVRDPGNLPAFEERFVREFGFPESKRKLVRTILREYRDRRREIEGQAAAQSRADLADAGRDVDGSLRGILPPEKRRLYDEWIARAREVTAPR